MKRPNLPGPAFRRLGACLLGGLVLALMWGPQQGSSTDYGYGFSQAVLRPRIFVFLAIGVLAHLAITYGAGVRSHLGRVGTRTFLAGAGSVLASYTLMHWYDPVGDGKFGALAHAVASTRGLPLTVSAFFGWGHWLLLALTLLLGGAAIATGNRTLAWISVTGSAVAAIITVVAHEQVVEFSGAIDHSLGAFTAALAYLAMAAGCVEVALGTRHARDAGRTRRPGLPLVAAGFLVGVCGFGWAVWFSPGRLEARLFDTRHLFARSGLSPVVVAYQMGLGWAILCAAFALAVAGVWLRRTSAAAAAALVSVVGVLLSLLTMHAISAAGGRQHVDGATGPWQNLGSGGWLTCVGFSLIAAGGYVTAARSVPRDETAPRPRPAGGDARVPRRGLLIAGVACAVFLPPTATSFWQSVLVSQIGVYVLLAIGLNVVVGWAGLLDLGFIAFYAIGSYTTAYLVGSLPLKPPHFLLLSPLEAIPFAIVVCLLVGIALGAPTLRLRGDYLAIVTLGFGEIIRIIAINNPGNITNSTRGPVRPIPHPVLHVGPIHIVWGENPLQYWYLLLVLIGLTVLLFHRIEKSRIGRAWTAVREDEVAARASGVNTTQVKLMAFAVGASTSGIAGVFFATQVGYFNPDNFVLNNSILVLAYVVFGGMGSIQGAIAGAAVLTWLPEFLKDQVPTTDRQMWIGAVVLLMMILRPTGLIPERRRQVEATLSAADAAPVTLSKPAEGRDGQAASPTPSTL